MDMVNVLLKLHNKEFTLLNIKEFDDFDISLFTRKHHNVNLCRYVGKLNQNIINEHARIIRSAMHSNGLNAWNSYMLITTDYEITHEEQFMIERDSKSIRRYVIRDESDFLRIPFLDDIEVVRNPLNLTSESKNKMSLLLSKINTFIKENGGEHGRIKNSEIVKNVPNIFDLEEK